MCLLRFETMTFRTQIRNVNTSVKFCARVIWTGNIRIIYYKISGTVSTSRRSNLRHGTCSPIFPLHTAFDIGNAVGAVGDWFKQDGVLRPFYTSVRNQRDATIYDNRLCMRGVACPPRSPPRPRPRLTSFGVTSSASFIRSLLKLKRLWWLES
jgi:hypothetical protein